MYAILLLYIFSAVDCNDDNPDSKCHGHGNCRDHDKNIATPLQCICDGGWTGAQCETGTSTGIIG